MRDYKDRDFLQKAKDSIDWPVIVLALLFCAMVVDLAAEQIEIYFNF